MHVPRVFVDAPLTPGGDACLEQEQAHYLTRVLRLKPGARLVLFNGRGGEYQAVLQEASARTARLEVGAYSAREAESPLSVRLAQGISRGERMDYTVQKAVELGVVEVVPLLTERCGVVLAGSRMEQRVLHWQKVVTGACAQCGRNRIPRVTGVREIRDWLRSTDPGAGSGLKLVLDPQADRGLAELPKSLEIHMLIGPEGGLTDDELTLAGQLGFTRVRLGPRVLRTETAAVAALAAIQCLWGDLGGGLGGLGGGPTGGAVSA